MSTRRAVAVAVLCLASLTAGAMQDSVKQSMQYVDKLEDDCVYDHGYQCVEVIEDDFISRTRERAWTAGPYLEAWSASYRDFLDIKEMSAEQKKLKHYKIGFTESESQYIVLYQGLLLPMLREGEVIGVMRATYGITTKYWIDKKTLEIQERLFLR